MVATGLAARGKREALCESVASFSSAEHHTIGPGVASFGLTHDLCDHGGECGFSLDVHRIVAIDHHAKLGKLVL
jgi:hypothetical protein